MSRNKAKFDVTNVVAAFLDRKWPEDSERAALMSELGAAMRYPAKPIQLLTAQVAARCLEQPGCTPEITVRMAITYGLVLGVLCERDRAERERRAS